MATPNDAQQGIPYGAKQPSASSFERLVDGLTTSKSVLIKALSNNPGTITIRSKDGSGTGEGMILESTNETIRVPLRFDNSSLEVKASVEGCTVTFIGSDE